MATPKTAKLMLFVVVWTYLATPTLPTRFTRPSAGFQPLFAVQEASKSGWNLPRARLKMASVPESSARVTSWMGASGRRMSICRFSMMMAGSFHFVIWPVQILTSVERLKTMGASKLVNPSTL